jgi:hypothetical protein
MRWRKQKRNKGLAGMCQGPRVFELWRNGQCIATVSPYKGFDRFTICGWYWYGGGINSLDTIGAVKTPEEAKLQAVAHFRN